MISVIIPVYNVEQFLIRCIDSVCAQTYTDFELLLINDGSSDNSGSICKQYASRDSRIQVININNRGVSNARNIGIENATGKFIVFIDADDYIEDNMLEILINAYEPGRICICGYYQETVLAKKIKKMESVFSDLDDVTVLSKSDFIRLYIKWLINSPWNKLYETDVIKSNHIKFPTDLSLGEDLLFNLEYIACKKGSFYILNIPLYHYVKLHNNSLSNQYNPNNHIEIQIRLYETLIDYCINIFRSDSTSVVEIYRLYLETVLDGFEKLYIVDSSINKERSVQKIDKYLGSKEIIKLFNQQALKRNLIVRILLKIKNYKKCRIYIKTIRTIMKIFGRLTRLYNDLYKLRKIKMIDRDNKRRAQC